MNDSLLDRLKVEISETEKVLHCTCNESRMSETARSFLNTSLSDRYFFGPGDAQGVFDTGSFLGRGLPAVADFLEQAEKAACKMLQASAVNLNLLSGVHAMMCSILATTDPGDRVMTVPLKAGGHFATKGIIDQIGRDHLLAVYDLESMSFDAEATAKIFHESKARALYLDVSYYIQPHNLTALRAALGPEAIIIYDASHTMGLILGGRFQSPFTEGADVITANTHKTLAGPHKGMIAFKDRSLAEKANGIINGCLYSTAQTNHLQALAVTLLEYEAFGADYADQVIRNSNAVAAAFESLGYEVRKASNGDYSHNHQVHVFVDTKGDRTELYKSLLNNAISTNFDTPLGDRCYIRFGTQELTRRGFKESDMKVVASLVHRSFQGEDLKKEVQTLSTQFSKIHYSFD